MYLCVGVSIWPISTIFIEFWNCCHSVVFFVFHFTMFYYFFPYCITILKNCKIVQNCNKLHNDLFNLKTAKYASIVTDNRTRSCGGPDTQTTCRIRVSVICINSTKVPSRMSTHCTKRPCW